jgi:signal transduction histidine kinase
VAEYLAGGPQRGPLPGAFTVRSWLASTVLAVCASVTTLSLLIGPGPHERPARLLLGILACGPIVVLRRWPVPVLAVAAVGFGVVMAFGNASLPVGLMLGVATYFVATKLPRRASIGVAAGTVAVLGAALLYSAMAVPNAPTGAQALSGLLPLLAAWFVGDSVAARRRYLAGLAEQAERERAAEAERARQEVREERVRIAHELHDVVAHTLAVITVQAGVGRRLMARRPEEASAALESIEMIGRTAQDELRVVLGLLREEDVAAALAPAPRLVDLKELADNVRASGTPVELWTSGTDRPLSPALELSLYRVAQEALTNVVKHAPGARVSVDLTISNGRVRLEVADDGGPARGAPGGEGAADLGTGHGIVGMRERVAAFGGWLVAEPLPGRGFHALAEIPVEAAV